MVAAARLRTIIQSMDVAIYVVIIAFLCVGLFACKEHPSGEAEQVPGDINLLELDAGEAVALIKSKQITATQLVTAVITNAKRYEHLNAYITLDENRALRQAALVDQSVIAGTASGKLSGVPLIIKDNIEVADMRITIGTPSIKGIVPQSHAPIVQLLVDQGAIILGKANMHELAVGVTSNNSYFGSVGNPYHQDYFAGGSSGGTAAAVASRAATAGLGTDTGGSVRIPAALTGICGLRPSSGRYPDGGVVPISRTRDTAGPMARSVADLILMNAVIMGREPEFQPADITTIRLGVPRAYFFANLEPGVARLIDETLQIIADTGIELVEVDIEIPSDIEDTIGFPLVIHEIREELPTYLHAGTAGQLDFSELVSGIASPDVKTIFETLFIGKDTNTAVEYKRVKEVILPEFQAVYRDYFDRNGLGAMIFPTTPLTAKRIQDIKENIELNGITVPMFMTMSRNTAPGSIAGIPGVTLPIGLSPSDGLPVGIAIDGPADSDEHLLSIAMALEKLFAPVSPPKIH